MKGKDLRIIHLIDFNPIIMEVKGYMSSHDNKLVCPQLSLMTSTSIQGESFMPGASMLRRALMEDEDVKCIFKRPMASGSRFRKGWYRLKYIRLVVMV